MNRDPETYRVVLTIRTKDGDPGNWDWAELLDLDPTCERAEVEGSKKTYDDADAAPPHGDARCDDAQCGCNA